MTQRVKLGFLGGGNMAEALVRGLLEQGRFEKTAIMVADVAEHRRKQLADTYGIAVTDSAAEVAAAAPTLIIAVKPFQVAPLLHTAGKELAGKLLMSIAAGISLSAMREAAPGARCIRVMPNTPSLAGAGMSVLCSGEGVTDEQRQEALDIFGAVGRAVFVEDEKLLDAVTGLSGSGPAYVFLFIEALADGGVKAGLPRALATELAAQTVLGAAKLVMETGKHPGELKDMVTSPGGTTIVGIGALERAGFRGAVMSAVEASAARAQALGKEK